MLRLNTIIPLQQPEELDVLSDFQKTVHLTGYGLAVATGVLTSKNIEIINRYDDCIQGTCTNLLKSAAARDIIRSGI